MEEENYYGGKPIHIYINLNQCKQLVLNDAIYNAINK